jgi:hypothetical protein
LNRSHLILAAALLFAALAVVQLLRSDEPSAAGESASELVQAPPPPPVSAAPAERGDRIPAAGRLRVEGAVTSTRGPRLAGVRVAIRGGNTQSVSDPTGAYLLEFEPGGSELALRFSADGYREREVALGPLSQAAAPIRLDVQLEPAPGAVLSGTLTTERGAPLAGERLQLQSPVSSARYVGVSGADGRFSIPGIEPGAGYYLTVRPQSAFADFDRLVEVGEDGLALDIELRELKTGRLTGRLVDAGGRPIPNLELSIVSGQAQARSFAIRTDADGRFRADGVPTGHLSFLTSAPESLVVGGILLRPGGEADVLLRADWGDGALRGRVVGAGGRPLGGAEVELSWSYASEEGPAARTNRTLVTDPSGSFEFRRLGDGIHQLDVRAPGHREVQLDYQVAPDSPGVEVELEPLREAG